jgi:hypothetical protein
MTTWAAIIHSESEATFKDVEADVKMCRDWYTRITSLTPSLSKDSSPSDDQQSNVLTSQAIDIAQGFSKLSRKWEKEGETALKSHGRPLSIEYISFDVNHRKSRFSRGKYSHDWQIRQCLQRLGSKITLSLHFVGNGRSERVWNSPKPQLEALTPEISL